MSSPLKMEKTPIPSKKHFQNQNVFFIVKGGGNRVTFGLCEDETGFEKNWLTDDIRLKELRFLVCIALFHICDALSNLVPFGQF